MDVPGSARPGKLALAMRLLIAVLILIAGTTWIVSNMAPAPVDPRAAFDVVTAANIDGAETAQETEVPSDIRARLDEAHTSVPDSFPSELAGRSHRRDGDIDSDTDTEPEPEPTDEPEVVTAATDPIEESIDGPQSEPLGPPVPVTPPVDAPIEVPADDGGLGLPEFRPEAGSESDLESGDPESEASQRDEPGPIAETPSDDEPVLELDDVTLEPESTPPPPAARRNATLRVTVAGGRGAPLRDVRVRVVESDSREELAVATTDTAGACAITDLPHVRVSVVVDPSSVPLGTSPQAAPDICRNDEMPLGFGAPCVVLDEGTADVAVELPYSSGLEGTVVDDNGRPAEGAIVRAVSRVVGFESVAEIVEADSDGRFFLSLVPGPYELQVVLPKGDGRSALSRERDVEIEPGSALFLDAIDFSREDAEAGSQAPDLELERAIAAFNASMDEAGATLASAPVDPGPLRIQESSIAPFEFDDDDDIDIDIDDDDAGDDAAAGVTIRGRVLSRWGEGVDGLDVTCRSTSGAVLHTTVTGDAGRFEFSGLDSGTVEIVPGAESPLDRANAHGVTLTKRPTAVSITTFEGQRNVTMEDVVVEVRRVFRIAGRVEVDPDRFEAFKRELIDDGIAPATFDDARFMQIYLRGLELVQTRATERERRRRRERSVRIRPDGTFEWSCMLPSEDVLFILRPRTSRARAGYDGPIGVEVTPAGVRRAELTFQYPPRD